MFRFASPYYLLLLSIIPAAIFYRNLRAVQPGMNVSCLKKIADFKDTFFIKTGWLLAGLKYLVLVFLIIALARPQWGVQRLSIASEGINIIMAVDISESMAALDFKRDGKIVNRLEAVKGVINSFVTQRSADRIGMVVFGTNAYTQIPLTRDYNALVTILERVKIGAAGKKTAIGDAIGISLKRLEDIKSKSNIIILLTDGKSNAGELSPRVATEIAVKRKVKIYTIGVGTSGKAPFLIKHPAFGDRYVYQRVEIDEALLQEIAEKSGGLYFKAEHMEDLEKVYSDIDRLEKTEAKVDRFAEYREFYTYFLMFAIVLLGLWLFLVNTRYLRIP